MTELRHTLVATERILRVKELPNDLRAQKTRFVALYALGHPGEVRSSCAVEEAKAMGVPQSTLYEGMDGLEEEDLVTRNRGLWSLTTRGIQELSVARRAYLEALRARGRGDPQVTSLEPRVLLTSGLLRAHGAPTSPMISGTMSVPGDRYWNPEREGLEQLEGALQNLGAMGPTNVLLEYRGTSRDRWIDL